jgi:hypothetical protein
MNRSPNGEFKRALLPQRKEKSMSESVPHREPRHPSELNSFFLIEGIIVGSLVLLVVSLVFLLGIFTLPGDGIRQGIVSSSLLLLAAAIPGTLIGLLVFRRIRKKAPSRTNLIVVPAFSGIVGGVVVGGIVAGFSLLWLFETTCC